jgi:4-hydroxy-tetrahydrodipicolinate reductase
VAEIPLLLYGATGRMGRAVRECLPDFPDIRLMACVAPREQAPGPAPGPVWLTPEELTTRRRREGLPEDLVVVDFSLAAGTEVLVRTLAMWPRALVCATTGLDEQVESDLGRLAARVPVFRAANLSLGIATVEELLRAIPQAARASFTADIVEHHHAGKKDAPSGTALRLAKMLGRFGESQREGGDVRIQSIRAGSVPGIHKVILSGPGETVEITHSVTDRSVFARGALRAARFIHGKAPGRYGIENLLRES